MNDEQQTSQAEQQHSPLSLDQLLDTLFPNRVTLPEKWKPSLEDVEITPITAETYQGSPAKEVFDFFGQLRQATDLIQTDLANRLGPDVTQDYIDRLTNTGVIGVFGRVYLQDALALPDDTTQSFVALIRHPDNPQEIVIAARVVLTTGETATVEVDGQPHECTVVNSALCTHPLYQRGYSPDREGKGLGLGKLVMEAAHDYMRDVLKIKQYVVGLGDASKPMLESMKVRITALNRFPNDKDHLVVIPSKNKNS